MQQTINFEPTAQVRQPFDVRVTIRRKKSFLGKDLEVTELLPIFAMSKIYKRYRCRQFTLAVFVSPLSENNITAPCRVCGNAPGSSACKTLTTRSAVSLCQKLQVMATTFIAGRAFGQPFSIKNWTDAKRKSLNLWLDQKSEFYSRIGETTVTRRLVIRINLVSLCLIIAAVAIEQQPITSAISALCAAYLVYRVNQSDKEGGNA